MLLRLAGKLVWGTTKLTIRYVVVPVAISAATAVVLSELSERVRAKTPVEPVISPEP